ncbi:biopolymer transport protein TolR [Natronocella acetinitrilica]|uniref:Tol-Pal system protein TolR n=1 Tax=Natronocella acetinitrilica TaxID=414046 RepID=A0AAE3KAC4_9GAMM|nr:protein TolR [Natronocella acetinitrilica]MCP1674090.1 biopolymer transport protein TolR [Natronocella acetinitrilica]
MRKQRGARRKPMSEINVVPYIDVMLVLLVIFMVTAPLLYHGVDVDLPEITSEPIDQSDIDPVVVTVTGDGEYTVSIGIDPDEPVTPDELMDLVARVMRNNPQTPVMVRGDRNVAYGHVLTAMSSLRGAGVPQVGLMTRPPQE